MENFEILDNNVVQQELRYVALSDKASSGKRFMNYIIDQIITLILMFLFGIVYASFNPEAEITRLMSYLISSLITLFYYAISESLTGKSIGKLITRTRVVNFDFSKPDLGTIFKRTFCRFIPFDAFSFLGAEPSGWHDSISETFVVDDNSIL